MTKFYITESSLYCRGSLGVAYYADIAEQALAIIKQNKTPWNEIFVTVNNTTYPAYVWTVDKLREFMKEGA